ncbi:penicillin-binding protein 2 [Limisalsivibrio acetivorans]|uniref:penicillin-binding protein 2 n=1 Tax=Limisalsivibrio acetivorans TaxID=1304888 RepID=UPI0003B725EC|nr:penicillin-binding protein 2 [Limisalsivibrio acetivorans]
MHLKHLSKEIHNYYKKRMKIYFAVLFLFFGVILLRLVYLQFFQHEKYKRLSESNRIRIVTVKADRGFIKDRKGKLLVRNAPSYELKVVKEDVPDMALFLKRVSQVVDLDIDYAKKQIRKSYLYEPAVIARGLTFKQVAWLLENSRQFRGLEIGLEPVRKYMESRAFSHVLGYLSEVTERDIQKDDHYTGGDMIGKTGIEKVYEEKLRGVNGAKHVEVDSYGRVLEVLSEKETTPGNNLVLTLDSDLQKSIHSMFEGRKGAAVVMDIEDFSLLSLYSAPTYNLEVFTPFFSSEKRLSVIKDKDKPLLNRALEGAYPPGSVFKILMAAAGLTEGKVTEDTSFTCTGSLKFGNFEYGCWKRGGHGSMKLVESLEQSCDVYYYQLGLLLGIDNIEKYAKKLSLGRITGINLPNEKSGSFPSRAWKRRRFEEPWYPGETIICSIGQGYITTTPLQIAVMLGGIFNGGYVYKPRVVDFIEDMITGEREEIEQELVNRMEFPQWVRDKVMEGMVEVIYGDRATGHRARVDGLTYGGKTGTAQVVSLEKTEDMEDDEIPEFMRDHSWFGAVLPAENPRYAIVALLQHGGAGSRGAAPVVGAIVNRMIDLGYVRTEQKTP